MFFQISANRLGIDPNAGAEGWGAYPIGWASDAQLGTLQARRC